MHKIIILVLDAQYLESITTSCPSEGKCVFEYSINMCLNYLNYKDYKGILKGILCNARILVEVWKIYFLVYDTIIYHHPGKISHYIKNFREKSPKFIKTSERILFRKIRKQLRITTFK